MAGAAAASKLTLTPSSSATFIQSGAASPTAPPTTFVILSSKENSPVPLNQPGKFAINLALHWEFPPDADAAQAAFSKDVAKNMLIFQELLWKL